MSPDLVWGDCNTPKKTIHISANPVEFSILAFNINLKINYSFATKHRSLSINSHQNDGHFVLTLKTILIYDGHFSIQNQCKNINSHQYDGFFILTLKTILIYDGYFSIQN